MGQAVDIRSTCAKSYPRITPPSKGGESPEDSRSPTGLCFCWRTGGTGKDLVPYIKVHTTEASQGQYICGFPQSRVKGDTEVQCASDLCNLHQKERAAGIPEL